MAILSGARSILAIDGAEIGFTSNVAFNEDFVYEPVRVINSIVIKELVPVAYGVGGSAGRLRVVGESLRNLVGVPTLLPRVGASPHDLLRNLVNMPNLTVQIQDFDGLPQFQLEGVRIAGHNIASAAGGLVGEDIALVGIQARELPELQ